MDGTYCAVIMKHAKKPKVRRSTGDFLLVLRRNPAESRSRNKSEVGTIVWGGDGASVGEVSCGMAAVSLGEGSDGSLGSDGDWVLREG